MSSSCPSLVYTRLLLRRHAPGWDGLRWDYVVSSERERIVCDEHGDWSVVLLSRSGVAYTVTIPADDVLAVCVGPSLLSREDTAQG